MAIDSLSTMHEGLKESFSQSFHDFLTISGPSSNLDQMDV